MSVPFFRIFQKSSPPSSGEVYKRCTELPEGIGPLPSKEQMAAKGLEAKVICLLWEGSANIQREYQSLALNVVKLLRVLD